jgi:two-component system NarL family sensor kinase
MSESTRDLRILKEIAEALNGAVNVDQALRDVLGRIADLLGLRTGWIWLVDPRTGRFYSATAQALPPYLRDPVRMTGTPCWCIEAFRGGRLTAGNIGLIECSRLRTAVMANRPGTLGFRYHASIPLHFGDRPLGIINVATPRWRRLTRRELDLLSTIASQLSMAIERARLAEESVRLARLEERTRFARDLHDTLTQGLTAIGLHIDAAMASVESGESGERAEARGQLERAQMVTRASLDEARRSLRELRGSPLEARPLGEALMALGRAMASDTGVRVHVEVRAEDAWSLAAETEEELYRIASEALTNVRRHADAKEVHMTLTRAARGRSARLTIVDDGKGFNLRKPRAKAAKGGKTAKAVKAAKAGKAAEASAAADAAADAAAAEAEAAAATGGFGLAGMRERAALIGGRFAISSRPGHGTQVSVTVPLDSTDDPTAAAATAARAHDRRPV